LVLKSLSQMAFYFSNLILQTAIYNLALTHAYTFHRYFPIKDLLFLTNILIFIYR